MEHQQMSRASDRARAQDAALELAECRTVSVCDLTAQIGGRRAN